MDFKQFYFSPDGRVNRKQWWLWLIGTPGPNRFGPPVTD
jgi:uncharacterized membrane protein YhaH (DUF805 family)